MGSIFLLISPLYYKQTIIFHFCSFTLFTSNVIVYNEVKNKIFFSCLIQGHNIKEGLIILFSIIFEQLINWINQILEEILSSQTFHWIMEFYMYIRTKLSTHNIILQNGCHLPTSHAAQEPPQTTENIQSTWMCIFPLILTLYTLYSVIPP